MLRTLRHDVELKLYDRLDILHRQAPEYDYIVYPVDEFRLEMCLYRIADPPLHLFVIPLSQVGYPLASDFDVIMMTEFLKSTVLSLAVG